METPTTQPQLKDAAPPPPAPDATTATAPARDAAADAAQDAIDAAAFKAVKASDGDLSAARRDLNKAVPPAPKAKPKPASQTSRTTPTPAGSAGTDATTDRPAGSTDAPAGGDPKDEDLAEGETAGEGGDEPKEGAEPPVSNPQLAALDQPGRIKYLQAEAALKRDGYSEAEVAELAEKIGVDKTIAMGQKRRDAQAKLDKAWSQRRGDAPANKNNGKPGSRPTSQREADPGRPDDDGAPGGDADPVDEDLKDLTPAQRKAAQARIDEATNARIQAEDALNRDRLERSIEKLTGTFPGLKTEDGLRQVLENLSELDPGMAALKDPPKLEALLRKAAWGVFGESINKTALQERRKQADATLDGQPHVPRTRGSGSEARAMTDEEYEKAALKAVLSSDGELSTARRTLASMKP